MQSISKKLKESRLKSKLTQAKLAEKAGVSTILISKLECGKGINPTVDTLKRIGKVLGVKVSWLVEGV